MPIHKDKPDAHEFAKRLNAVLDDVPDCPPLKDGRGVWIAKLYKVSQPTGWAWLNGNYQPSPARVRDMATRWKVSYDWLYFNRGERDGVPQTEKNSEDGSRTVSLEDLKLAIALTAEALGRQESSGLSPAQYSELVFLVLDLLENGMEDAVVLQFARRWVTAWEGAQDDKPSSRPKRNRTANPATAG